MVHRATAETIAEQRGAYKPGEYWYEIYDFHGDAGDTLANPWASDGQTANSTEDFVTDVENGEYQLAFDGTSEAQAGRLSWGEHLALNMSRLQWIEFRAKVAFASGGALGSADQRLVIGLCSGLTNAEDTLDDVTTNAWFRIEGNNANILIEGDDGTTDTDDDDSDIDMDDDSWALFRIDPTDLSSVKFYVDKGGAGDSYQFAGSVDMSDLSADTAVEPVACMQRDGGSEQEDVRMDLVRFLQSRS